MTDLARRLGLTGAIFIGLGSMLGAGVFAVWGPATAAAGAGLPFSLGIAAVVAVATALSSARHAARYPVSGGTYDYGREVLGPWWGFLAGWGFIIGKTASCAAMALTFAAYVLPDSSPWQRPLGAALVVLVAFVNSRGVTRTAVATTMIVACVLAVLVPLIVVTAGGGRPPATPGLDAGIYGVLQAAGLLFFAFAGYARIATMGEEVRQPRRTIPRAVVVALAAVLVLYGLVGWTLATHLGLPGLATSSAPVLDLARTLDPSFWPVAVRVAAALASAGALLGLVAGVGRTSLAMAREGDLPAVLGRVHERYRVPSLAELGLGLLVAAVVLVADVRGAIGFSGAGVLLYYFVANLASWRMPDEAGGRPLAGAAVAAIGMVGCLTLVATLPWTSLAAAAAIYLVGIGYRAVRQRRRPGGGQTAVP